MNLLEDFETLQFPCSIIYYWMLPDGKCVVTVFIYISQVKLYILRSVYKILTYRLKISVYCSCNMNNYYTFLILLSSIFTNWMEVCGVINRVQVYTITLFFSFIISFASIHITYVRRNISLLLLLCSTFQRL